MSFANSFIETEDLNVWKHNRCASIEIGQVTKKTLKISGGVECREGR